MSPQYLADLISWYAIGARTTESQTHREMASGLSTPVGFKNGTDGGLEVAINAIHSARSPHSFLGINPTAALRSCARAAIGYGHLVLRGGGGRPNYDTVSVRLAEQALAKANLAANIVVDCSHGNSMKDPCAAAAGVHGLRAPDQGRQPLDRRADAGEQPARPATSRSPRTCSQLRYGVSVTDACIDWATTADLLRRAASELSPCSPHAPADSRTSHRAAMPVSPEQEVLLGASIVIYRFTGIVNSGPLLGAVRPALHHALVARVEAHGFLAVGMMIAEQRCASSRRKSGTPSAPASAR